MKDEASPLSKAERARLKDLAILSELRGTDSSGILAMYEKGNGRRLVTHVKSTATTSQLIENGEGNGIFSDNKMVLIAGHSRAATIGNISEKNAHPFRCGDIFGMHNGTIPGMGNKDKTDSQELFETLNTLDRSEWKDFFLKIDKVGAYALVFVDIKTNRLYIIRNNDRTLYYTDYLGVRYFSSEYQMLSFWRSRLNISQGKIETFEPLTLYSWKLSNFKDEEQVKYEKPSSYTYNSHWSYHGAENSALIPWEDEEDKGAIPFSSTSNKQGPSVPLVPKNEEEKKFIAYRGKKMSTTKAQGLLQYGCTICDKVSSLKDVTWWSNNTSHICDNCRNKSPFVKEYYNRNPQTCLYRAGLVKEEGTDNDKSRCC